MQNIKRRDFLKLSVLGFLFLSAKNSLANPLIFSKKDADLADFVLKNQIENPGNFQAIYGDESLKAQFYLFLENVYNIYPEKEFHQLIDKATKTNKTDEETYIYILANLSSVKPFLSDLRYALPALAKQKKEIAQQTADMLATNHTFNGYLEIGTPGRYVANLKNEVKISGKTFLVNVKKPNYSPIDIAERGGLLKAGEFIPLNNYDPISSAIIKAGSLDLVTNYIGFHHSPLEKLENFVLSIHKTLRAGGSFILREHDVIDANINHLVALAHDVFNVGLKVDWQTNHQEIRNFRPIKSWIEYLEKRGFKYQNKIAFQKGDPTKNGLIKFVKI